MKSIADIQKLVYLRSYNYSFLFCEKLVMDNFALYNGFINILMEILQKIKTEIIVSLFSGKKGFLGISMRFVF